MSSYKMIITKYGQDAIAESELAKEAIKLIQMGAGDSNGEYYESTAEQLSLRNDIWRGNIIDLSRLDDVSIFCGSIIPPEAAPDGGWLIREVGIYDDKGGLFAVGSYPITEQPDSLLELGKQIWLEVVIQLNNISVIQLITGQSNMLVNRSEFNQLADVANEYFSAFNISTVELLINSKLPNNIKIIKTAGYYDIFGKSDVWRRTATITTPSQTALELNQLAVSDANGVVWSLDISDGRVYIDSIGAIADGVTDAWGYLELALKNAEQNNRVVTCVGTKYLFSKPIILKTGRHLEFNANLGVNIIYGGGVLTENDAPTATTPIGSGFVSVFSGVKAQVIVVHSNKSFAKYFSLRNMFIYNRGGAVADYGVYCPFGNQFQWENVQHSNVMTGFDSRNLYTGSFQNSFFSAPNGIMGTAGVNITPIKDSLGSGTSLTLDRVGVLGFRCSFNICELNYSTITSSYSEGGMTRSAFNLLRCNGLVINSYGIENLKAVNGDGCIINFIDSQVTVNALQASYNVDLSGVSAMKISGVSQVTINDPFLATVGSAYVPFQTDNTSNVRVFGFKWVGVTPLNNLTGNKTIMYGEQGKIESAAFPGGWNGGLIKIGAVSLWDDGSSLRFKRGSDPSSNIDGVQL